MPPATIEQQLRRFMEENFLLGQQDMLKGDDSFLEAGILDSTGVLQLVAFLEGNYGITFDEGDLTPENLDSINNIMAYLSRKMGSRHVEGDGLVPCVTAPGGDE